MRYFAFFYIIFFKYRFKKYSPSLFEKIKISDTVLKIIVVQYVVRSRDHKFMPFLSSATSRRFVCFPCPLRAISVKKSVPSKFNLILQVNFAFQKPFLRVYTLYFGIG